MHHAVTLVAGCSTFTIHGRAQRPAAVSETRAVEDVRGSVARRCITVVRRLQRRQKTAAGATDRCRRGAGGQGRGRSSVWFQSFSGISTQPRHTAMTRQGWRREGAYGMAGLSFSRCGWRSAGPAADSVSSIRAERPLPHLTERYSLNTVGDVDGW